VFSPGILRARRSSGHRTGKEADCGNTPAMVVVAQQISPVRARPAAPAMLWQVAIEGFLNAKL
jgi:hypothetical protein